MNALIDFCALYVLGKAKVMNLHRLLSNRHLIVDSTQYLQL